jgi:uracil-DNA glycosylase
MNWDKTLGTEWYSLLNDFVESKDMNEIICSVAKERSEYTIYPLKEDFYKMFRIFKDLKPSDIKVIIIGQDPFPDNSGTGYAFCNGGKLPSRISPSLKNILEEITRNDTEKEKLCLDELDLERWVKQGVFLVNSYLTVRKGQPGLHKFWQPFTFNWIRKLNKYDNIIWLLWGAVSHRITHLIKNSTHEIIKTSHPSPLGFKKVGRDYDSFYNSKCFERVNNTLWARNKNMIKW